MGSKNGNVSRGAWKLLRLALLWARKGGVFRRSLMAEVPKFLKSLGHPTAAAASTTPRFHLHRQLSFDKTPIIPAKIHRPSSMRFNIPCITSQVDFDYDFDIMGDDEYHEDGSLSEERTYGYGNDDREERIEEEERGIDARAEEFIAKFYKQMKLQRQLSYLRHNETPVREAS